jgi:hypothetical protein
MVVACTALVFAMTGAGYAAGMQGPNTVGTKQLKKNAVISSKVKNGSLLRADFKSGQIPAGPQGPAGPAGPQGPPGAPNPQRHQRSERRQAQRQGGQRDHSWWSVDQAEREHHGVRGRE